YCLHPKCVLRAKKWTGNKKKPRGDNPSFATAEGDLFRKLLLGFQDYLSQRPMFCVGFAHRVG
ncbi:MAG: hypothetical protein ACKN82_15635, partial [Pirellula sp.]